MLEFPEQNSCCTVQQAGPLPGLILHPDLVSAQRRLKHYFQNMIIKASGSASHQPALLFVWELIIKFQITGHKAFTRLRKNVFSPSTPVHPRSQAPGWLCRLGSWQISCGAGSPRCCRAVPLYPQSTTPPGGTEESEYSFRCPSLQPPRPQGGAAEPPGHDTGVGRQEAALALPWRRDTRWMTWIYLK